MLRLQNLWISWCWPLYNELLNRIWIRGLIGLIVYNLDKFLLDLSMNWHGTLYRKILCCNFCLPMVNWVYITRGINHHFFAVISVSVILWLGRFILSLKAGFINQLVFLVFITYKFSQDLIIFTYIIGFLGSWF